MSGIGTGYDLSVSTYSPDGRCFQTEYAQKAIDNSGTAIGIKCKDGVILGVEKQVVSKMLEASSNRRAYPLDRHAGVVVAGLAADGRQVVNRGISEASSYKSFYGEAIPGHVMCKRLAGYVHVFNLYWYVRPFGTASLLASYDRDGPALYLVEPSGHWHSYYACAVGKGRQAARTDLERLLASSAPGGGLACADGLTELCKILLRSHEGEKAADIELAWVCDASDKQFQRVPQEIADAALAAAKASLEESDMED